MHGYLDGSQAAVLSEFVGYSRIIVPRGENGSARKVHPTPQMVIDRLQY